MGLSFLGNPYENEYEYDTDEEINSVEELILPPNVTNVFGAIGDVRNNFFNAIFTNIEDDTEEDWDGSHEDTIPDDDDEFDVDYNPDDDNGSYSPDDEYNPDDENYPEDEEVQNFITSQDNNRFVLSDSDDDELDYVTYPTNNENGASTSSQPEKVDETPSAKENGDSDS